MQQSTHTIVKPIKETKITGYMAVIFCTHTYSNINMHRKTHAHTHTQVRVYTFFYCCVLYHNEKLLFQNKLSQKKKEKNTLKVYSVTQYILCTSSKWITRTHTQTAFENMIYYNTIKNAIFTDLNKYFPLNFATHTFSEMQKRIQFEMHIRLINNYNCYANVSIYLTCWSVSPKQ